MHQFDLTGQVIKISTRLNNFYEYDAAVEIVIISDGQNGNRTEYRLSKGYSVDVFLCLQTILNFTYLINPNVDIYDLKNSSRNDVDLYLAALSLYEGRVRYADPTVITGYSSVVALINHEFEDVSTDVLATTFSLRVLCVIHVLIMTFLTVLGLLAKRENESFIESQVQGLAIIFHQDGFGKLSKSVSSRIVLLVLSVFLMILSASFTGNMISMSAIHEHEINSVDDILNSDFEILLELGAPNSTIRLMLEHMTQLPKVTDLMSRIVTSEKKHKPHNISGYIQLVKESPTAYVMDLESAVAAVQNDMGYMPCTWGTFPIFDLWYPWTMFMKKGSPYRPAINYGIVKLRETGTMDRIRQKWLPRGNSCKQENHSFQSIKISQIQSGFICILIGYGLAMVLLAAENFKKRKKFTSDRYVRISKHRHFIS